MDNPYAPPTPVSGSQDLSPRAPFAFEELKFTDALLRGFIASVAAAVCVLVFQFARITFGWNAWPPKNSTWLALEALSFVSAAFFTALAFCMSWKRDEFDVRSFTWVCMVGVVGVLVFIPAMLWLRSHARWASVFFVVPASQITTLIAICWIRRVPIRWFRLLVGAVVGSVAWFGLVMLLIFLVVNRQSHPYDDYTGYTTLTVCWVWTVAAQIPFLFSRPKPLFGDAVILQSPDDSAKMSEVGNADP